jgi:hypothetical protein
LLVRILQPFTLKLSLEPRLRAVCFLLFIGLLGVAGAIETFRVGVAEFWEESSDAIRVQRAMALDGGNPELYHWLSFLNTLNGVTSVEDAVHLSRRATELNPHQARYWLGLARACYLAGDRACADQSFDRAVELAPMQPSMEWESGIYYAATDRPEAALVRFHRFLDLSPERADQVFQLTWRMFDDPAVVWRDLVEKLHNPRVKCAYLTFLASKNRFDLASRYWVEAIATTEGLSFGDAAAYLQRLLDAKEYDEAARVWQDLLRLGIIAYHPSQPRDNLIFNARFDQPSLNAGFDWQTREQEYIAVDFTDHSLHDGRNALRVEFTVPHNTEYEPVYQLVRVVSGQSYTLTARVRSQEITSDSGPRIRIEDPRCPQCLDIATETSVGTTPWHDLRLSFVTGPQTDIVRISVWRPRSRTYPMDTGGEFWLSSISLTGGSSSEFSSAASPLQ